MSIKQLLLLGVCLCTVMAASEPSKKKVSFNPKPTIIIISAASVTVASTPIAPLPQPKKTTQQPLAADIGVLACNRLIHAQLVRQGNPYAQMYYQRHVLEYGQTGVGV